jgi:hypothetical protein
MAIFAVKQFYKVLKKFNSEKDYGVKIRPQYATCLSMLKVGQKINQKDFASEFGNVSRSSCRSDC